FVARQAALALDRAERRLRGARYKVPRFVEEEIVARPAFRGAVARLARRLGRDDASVTREARRYLREIAASHSPRLIHLAANLIRYMYTRGYGETLHYDREQLAALAALGQRHPLVFLPSPVSIAYGQIQDVAGYAAEERGAAKQAESFGWFLRFVRALRRRYGEIYIRFGEPLSLARALGPPDPGAEPDPDEQSLALQKLAFAVAVRINRATPITAISLVTLALLGTANRALSVDETIVRLRNLLDYVRRRNLPTAGDLGLDTREGVQRALDALVENG